MNLFLSIFANYFSNSNNPNIKLVPVPLYVYKSEFTSEFYKTYDVSLKIIVVLLLGK